MLAVFPAPPVPPTGTGTSNTKAAAIASKAATGTASRSDGANFSDPGIQTFWGSAGRVTPIEAECSRNTGTLAFLLRPPIVYARNLLNVHEHDWVAFQYELHSAPDQFTALTWAVANESSYRVGGTFRTETRWYYAIRGDGSFMPYPHTIMVKDWLDNGSRTWQRGGQTAYTLTPGHYWFVILRVAWFDRVSAQTAGQLRTLVSGLCTG